MAFTNNLFKKPKMPSSLYGYQGAGQVATPATTDTTKPVGYKTPTAAGTTITVTTAPQVQQAQATQPAQVANSEQFSTWGNTQSIADTQPPVDTGGGNGGTGNDGTGTSIPGPVTTTCQPGYHWDEATQSCVLDATSMPGPVNTTCAPGYYWNGVACVPVEESTTTPTTAPTTTPKTPTVEGAAPPPDSANAWGVLQDAYNMTGNGSYNLDAIGGANWDKLPDATKQAVLSLFRTSGFRMGEGSIIAAIRAYQPANPSPSTSGTGDSMPGPVRTTYIDPETGQAVDTESTPNTNATNTATPTTTTTTKTPLDAYKEALLAQAPNKWNQREWFQLPESTRQFILSAMESYGWSADDVQEILAKGLPQFSAPKYGSVR